MKGMLPGKTAAISETGKPGDRAIDFLEIAVSQVTCDFGMNGATTTVNTYMGEAADAASPPFESYVGKTGSGSR